MLAISIISIFAIILFIQLRSRLPAPQQAANLNKGPYVDKHCWYEIVTADTLIILTHLTFNHRSLSTIVDTP